MRENALLKRDPEKVKAEIDRLQRLGAPCLPFRDELYLLLSMLNVL